MKNTKGLYHGSHIANIKKLKANSKLHGTDEFVAYATTNIPYALLFVWDETITGYSGKHVTGWIKNGITFYEEQFPNQLKTFYKGARGYLYRLEATEGLQKVSNREEMYYSPRDLLVANYIYIDDIYVELMRYEEMGQFLVLTYDKQSKKRKKELTDLIASTIIDEKFYYNDVSQREFMKKYFKEAWMRAIAIEEIQRKQTSGGDKKYPEEPERKETFNYHHR